MAVDIQVYKRVAYLMKPIAGSTDNMDMEEYVLDEAGNKILIDNDGARVLEIAIKVGKTVRYEYKWADAQGNYKDAEDKEYTEPQVWYNNDGTLIEK